MEQASVLKEKINKKQIQLEKYKQKLIKLKEEKDSEEKFQKKYSGWYDFEEREAELREYWLKDHNYEISRCEYDIESTTTTLNKYSNMLMLAEERESKPVIHIFKEFLDHWKDEIRTYTLDMYKKYREVNSQYCDMYNHYRGEDRKEKLLELSNREKALRSISWVDKRYWCGSDDKFDEFLDKYMVDRYYELVNKITKVIGEISDVSALWVGYDGRLNGIIEGNLGKARLETIVAGGYNENIIVNVKHGQCAHYRVLVHKLKEKK